MSWCEEVPERIIPKKSDPVVTCCRYIEKIYSSLIRMPQFPALGWTTAEFSAGSRLPYACLPHYAPNLHPKRFFNAPRTPQSSSLHAFQIHLLTKFHGRQYHRTGRPTCLTTPFRSAKASTTLNLTHSILSAYLTPTRTHSHASNSLMTSPQVVMIRT